MKCPLFSQLAFILVIISCASGHRKTSSQLRKLVASNRHQEAISVLNESRLAEDPDSKLLYHFELGMLEHYQRNYQASVDSLHKAKEIIDELYTTKVSGKLQSILTNDNSDFYYGEKFEVSLTYFYLSLNYYMMAQIEGDLSKRRELLFKGRSEIMAWDTFINEMKNDRAGKALFKEDLLAKTFGALIHESQDNNKDDQIALQLYKDALEVLFKNYNLFPTFNESYEVFKENFSNLPKLSKAEVAGKYVRATKHHQELQDFLTQKILILTKKLRPQELKDVIASLKPSETQINALKNPTSNVTILVQEGLISAKIPRKYEFPMHWGGHTGLAVSLVGNRISFELPHVDSDRKSVV